MTLSQVATITRRTILASIILLVLGIAFIFGYSIWHTQYIASLPKPEEQPDVKFGILPKPDFSPSKLKSSNFSYQLATQTGSLPDFGKLVKVYFLPKATATFLNKEKVKTLAAKFNIDKEPEATNEGRYQFKKDKQNLAIDKDSGNFTYRVGATPTAQLFQIPENQVIQNFRDFLSSLGILKDELKDSSAKVDGHTISIWPVDLDKKPIVTSNFKHALVRAEASQSAKAAEDYYLINYTFWPVDQTTFSTYPIKTTAQALENLKSGGGTVVIESKSPKVSITSVYLAYFEGENYSPYLQPIFVFEGPNFVAYVPAVTDQYISK